MSAAARERDTRARRLAQSVFDRPLVLQAGAGTGKTATLVARVVSWCLGPGWERAAETREEEGAIARRVLEGVVAITFTEAAAAEMAERVGQALAALELGTDLPKGLQAEQLQPRDPGERRLRARALLASLDRLTVRTIHAWCLRLLSEHPLEAGLPPRFEVDADGSRLDELARESVEEALRDEGPVRRALLELAVRDVQPESVVGAVALLASEGVDPEAIARDRFPAERLAELAHAIRESLADFEGVDAGRLAGVPASAKVTHRALAEIAALTERLQALGAEPDRAALGAAAEEHADQLERLREWAAGNFNRSEAKALGEDAPDAAEAIAPAVAAWDELARARLSVLEPARAALAPLVAGVRERLHDSGRLSYSDLLRLARDLLKNHDGVRRLQRARLDQLLVDEFQDTDRVQCELVALLGLPVEGDEAGPGLFLVGDPKQSIYGWRSADLAAYHGFVREVRDAGGEVHELQVNFRSAPPILEEVERLIQPVMIETESVQPPFEELLPCEKKLDDPGFTERGRAPVEYWDCRDWEPAIEPGERAVALDGTSTSRGAEIEAAAIARDVLELHLDAGRPWGDFAILLRTSTHQETFLRALRERGVPFEVGKDRSYYRRREVVDAGALVRTVLDPHDHLALLTWLRSPAVGVPDAALVPLWTRSLPELCTRLARPGDEAAVALEQALTACLGELDPDTPGLAAIEGWDASVRFALEALAVLRAGFVEQPPDRWVELLRTGSGVEAIESARWLGSYRAANLERFFRELEEELLDPEVTRHDVLRRLRRAVSEEQDAEEGRPRQEQADAVQVMSIHSAKGLDFGHVYLPRLDNPGREGHRPATGAAWSGEDWELRLFGAETPGWRDAHAQARAVERAERVRLLYVAITRAKHRLVLSSLKWSAAPAEEASVLSQLVANREAGLGDFDELGAEAGTDGFGRCARVEAEALWQVCALAELEDPPRRAERAERARLPSAEDAAAAALRLAERRERAAQRAERPWLAAASSAGEETPAPERHEERAELVLGGTSEAPAADREGLESGELARAQPSLARGAARAAGTAVHRVLEELELAAGPDGLREAAEGAAENARALAAPGDAEAAAEAARVLVEQLADGACARRLFELGEEHVLARELPLVLAPSGDDGPVGGFAGAIDLVYRDPETGEVVVADYKTDDLSGEEGDREALERHGAQLAIYRDAVQRALRLEQPPRAELWLLRPGRIVVVPSPAGG